MKNKIVAFVLAATMVCSALVGCGTSQSDNQKLPKKGVTTVAGDNSTDDSNTTDTDTEDEDNNSTGELGDNVVIRKNGEYYIEETKNDDGMSHYVLANKNGYTIEFDDVADMGSWVDKKDEREANVIRVINNDAGIWQSIVSFGAVNTKIADMSKAKKSDIVKTSSDFKGDNIKSISNIKTSDNMVTARLEYPDGQTNMLLVIVQLPNGQQCSYRFISQTPNDKYLDTVEKSVKLSDKTYDSVKEEEELAITEPMWNGFVDENK